MLNTSIYKKSGADVQPQPQRRRLADEIRHLGGEMNFT